MTEGGRIVVVGNGMAGARFVEELRRRDSGGRWQVTVIGAEPHAAYNRVLLSNVLAGSASASSIRLVADEHSDPTVHLLSGVSVDRVDRERQEVVTDDGKRFGYDVLVMATGSRPIVPPIPGLHTATGELVHGAAVFRTLDDCDRIVQLAESSETAVVLGGGLLGLEAARGLTGRGLSVQLVHLAPHLMERQLDAAAGEVLRQTLHGLGIRVHVAAAATAVRTCSTVEGVVLADGTVLAADVLVVACGVAPETALAKECGLDVDRGVVVDDHMRTSDSRIFAIGECAQHAGQVYGLVAPAWEQAAVVADVLTATHAAGYSGSRLVTRLKAAGVELAAMGDIDGDTAPGAEPSDGDEVIQFIDPSRGTYKKVVIRAGRVVGAIMLGDVSTAATITQLYDRGAVAPSDRLTLLFSNARSSDTAESPALIPDRATVCRCNGVTKRAITSCWLDGARTADEVSDRTRAGTGCGTCRDAVAGIVDWLAQTAASEPAPAAPAEVTA